MADKLEDTRTQGANLLQMLQAQSTKSQEEEKAERTELNGQVLFQRLQAHNAEVEEQTTSGRTSAGSGSGSGDEGMSRSVSNTNLQGAQLLALLNGGSGISQPSQQQQLVSKQTRSMSVDSGSKSQSKKGKKGKKGKGGKQQQQGGKKSGNASSSDDEDTPQHSHYAGAKFTASPTPGDLPKPRIGKRKKSRSTEGVSVTRRGRTASVDEQQQDASSALKAMLQMSANNSDSNSNTSTVISNNININNTTAMYAPSRVTSQTLYKTSSEEASNDLKSMLGIGGGAGSKSSLGM